MPDRIDARVPVRLAAALAAAPPDGTMMLFETGALVEAGLALPPGRGDAWLRRVRFTPDHEPDAGAAALACPCCTGRAPFATTLGALFNERARGTAPFFGAVLAVGSPSGLDHARRALGADPFLLGRYRLEDRSDGACPAAAPGCGAKTRAPALDPAGPERL